MIKIIFSVFFFGCVLFFLIKTKLWEKNTLDKFKIRGGLIPKILVLIGVMISIYFLVNIFVTRGFYTNEDIYSFLYLAMLLLFMTHLTFGKLVISKKGIIYKGRFINWYDINNYEIKDNAISISYEGSIENEISFKVKSEKLNKIDYYLRTRIK